MCHKELDDGSYGKDLKRTAAEMEEMIIVPSMDFELMGKLLVDGEESEELLVSNKVEKEVPSEYEGKNVKLTATSPEAKKDYFCDEVLQTIFTKMSFPSIFNVRELSKDWHLRFSPTSLQPSVFQKEVSLVSLKWPSCCPIFFTSNGIIGFDRALSEWTLLAEYPNLSLRPTFISCAGALVCQRSGHMPMYTSGEVYSLIILNVLTKSHRVLKVPKSEFCFPVVVRLLSLGSFAYKVIVIAMERTIIGNPISTHVYDSATSIWTHSTRAAQMDLYSFVHIIHSAVYVDGIWYRLSVKKHCLQGLRLFRFDGETGTFSSDLIVYDNQDVMSFLGEKDCLSHGILVCTDRIIVCIYSPSIVHGCSFGDFHLHDFYYIDSDSILICELDLETLQLTEIAEGPSPNLVLPVGEMRTSSITSWPMDKLQFSMHGDIIYFGRSNPLLPMLAFDLRSTKWEYLSATAESLCPMTENNHYTWGQCAFQPGLNPFAIV